MSDTAGRDIAGAAVDGGEPVDRAGIPEMELGSGVAGASDGGGSSRDAHRPEVDELAVW